MSSLIVQQNNINKQTNKHENKMKMMYADRTRSKLYGFIYVYICEYSRTCCALFCLVLFQLSSAYTERWQSIPFGEWNQYDGGFNTHWSFHYDKTLRSKEIDRWHACICLKISCCFLSVSFLSLPFSNIKANRFRIERIVLRWPHKLLHHYNL